MSTSVKAVPGLLVAWPEFDATGKFANTLPDMGEVSPHIMTPVSYLISMQLIFSPGRTL